MTTYDLSRALRLWSFLILLGVTLSTAVRAQEAGSPPTAAKPAPEAEAVKPQPADPAAFPEVVARVNGVAIPKQDLLDQIEVMRFRVGLPDSGLPIDIYRTVLDDVIGMELLHQMAQEANLIATSEEIDDQVHNMQAQFPSEDAFMQQLQSEGMSLDGFKAVMKKEISIRKFVMTNVAPTVQVEDAQLRSFYDENLESMQKPLELKVRHILLRAPKESSDEDKAAVRARLETIREQIVSGGADFAAMARENSNDTGTKESGGELTLVQGQTVPEFEEAAFALANPGDISPVTATSYGYHLIQLVERIPERTITFEEAQPRIQMYLKQQSLQKAVQSEVEKRRSAAQIDILL